MEEGKNEYMSEWIDEKSAAAYLHCSIGSLRRWRANGKSASKIDPTPPPCNSCGSRFLYNKKALDAWLQSMAVKAEAK